MVRQEHNCKINAHLWYVYYAGGVVVMLETRKLCTQITGRNLANTSSLVSSKYKQC